LFFRIPVISVPRVPLLTIILKKSLLLSHIHAKCVL
jgi:hypothetical protein